MSKNLKRALLGGLGAIAMAGGLLTAAVPAIAAEGDNHYSRQHPDSYGYEDPGYAAGGIVAGAGDVARDTVDGAGDVVAGTVGGVTGAVAGVTDPYVRAGPRYYGDGRVYQRHGYTYYRRGTYYYPAAPRANGYYHADRRWDWSSDGQFRRGMAVRGSAPDRGDYEPMSEYQPDNF